jgi:Protein of unknown function (DUF3386)
MKLHLWMAGAAFLISGTLQAAEGDKPKGDPRAAALMEEASKTRYVWSPEVKAVSGEFAWEQDGKSGTGTFHDVLHQRRSLKITGEGGTEVPGDVKEHIGSMIGHRVPPAPGAAARPQRPAVIVVEDDERGPLIMTVGDPMQSTERVKDGKLVQVNRFMGGKRFTIDVTEFDKAPEGRVYPSAFTVTWWDADTGKRTEKQVYTTQGLDTIDGQLFPKAEKVVSEKDGKTSTLEIRYSNVKFEMSGR